MERSLGRVLLDSIAEGVVSAFFFLVMFVVWAIQWSVALVVFVAVMASAGYYVFMSTLDGGDHVTVPNLVGLDVTQATYELSKRNLELGNWVDNVVPHPTVPKDHIVAQRPAPGRVVRTGRKITPTVSLGTDKLTAPDLRRLAFNDAKNRIAESPFQIGKVSYVQYHTSPNTVLSQDPPAGSPLENQAQINLLVSKREGEGRDLLPDLIGLTVQQAEEAVSELGVILEPQVVDYEGAEEDVVLAQDPAANSLVQEGQVVMYEIKPSRQERAERYVLAELIHRFPFPWYDKNVRVDVVDQNRNRESIREYPAEFSSAARGGRVEGSGIKIADITYRGEATVEIYVDGQLHESYILRDGQEPIRRGLSRR